MGATLRPTEKLVVSQIAATTGRISSVPYTRLVDQHLSVRCNILSGHADVGVRPERKGRNYLCAGLTADTTRMGVAERLTSLASETLNCISQEESENKSAKQFPPIHEARLAFFRLTDNVVSRYIGKDISQKLIPIPKDIDEV